MDAGNRGHGTGEIFRLETWLLHLHQINPAKLDGYSSPKHKPTPSDDLTSLGSTHPEMQVSGVVVWTVGGVWAHPCSWTHGKSAVYTYFKWPKLNIHLNDRNKSSKMLHLVV